VSKKALIEKGISNYMIDNGYRVAEVVNTSDEFEINTQLLEWVTCPDHIKADLFVYDSVNQSFIPVPFTISEYTPNGNTTTIMSCADGHNLQTGDTIQLKDADDNLLSGTHTVTVVDDLHITIPTPSYDDDVVPVIGYTL
jgi:uncharacterized Zn ribbon protein